MRIIIETTEAETVSTIHRGIPGTRESEQTATSSGGEAPGHLRAALDVQHEALSGPSSAGETDAGSPPSWLMDAVGNGGRGRSVQKDAMPFNGSKRW